MMEGSLESSEDPGVEEPEPLKQISIGSTASSSVFSSSLYALFVCTLAIFIDSISYGLLLLLLPNLTKASLLNLWFDNSDTRTFIDSAESLLAFLYSLYAIGLCVSTLFVGVGADKYFHRRMPLFVGSLVHLVAVLLFAFSYQRWILMLARLLQGVAASFNWVLCWTIVAETFSLKKRLGLAMSALSCANIAGIIICPPLSLLISFEGVLDCSIVFFSLACLIGLQLLVIFFYQPAALDQVCISPLLLSPSRSLQTTASISDTAKQTEYDLFEGMRPAVNTRCCVSVFLCELKKYFTLLAHREIYLDAFAVILSSLSQSLIESVLSDFIQEKFNMDVQSSGYTMLAFILPDFFASVFIGYLADKYNNYLLILFGFLLHSLGAIGLGYVGSQAAADNLSSYLSFVGGLVFFNVSLSFISTTCMPLFAMSLLTIHETSSYAKIYAIYNICYSLGMVLGPYFSHAVHSFGGSIFHATLVFPLLTLLFIPFYTYQLFKMNIFRKMQSSSSVDIIV